MHKLVILIYELVSLVYWIYIYILVKFYEQISVFIVFDIKMCVITVIWWKLVYSVEFDAQISVIVAFDANLYL